MRSVQHKNSNEFIAFLEALLVKTYHVQATIPVADNALYHCCTTVRSALSLIVRRVPGFWLLQYCSELNVIERF